MAGVMGGWNGVAVLLPLALEESAGSVISTRRPRKPGLGSLKLGRRPGLPDGPVFARNAWPGEADPPGGRGLCSCAGVAGAEFRPISRAGALSWVQARGQGPALL